MCPESFGVVRFDITLCMSRFNHVPSGDTLRQDAISSYIKVWAIFLSSGGAKYSKNKT